VASAREPFRKLTRLGKHSYYVLIPPEIVRDLNWRERQKVAIERQGDQIILKDWKPEAI
jgi:bifunctional DNA-binding transcriptional regulator/antitoxin component of YhaV-PrlF toxin-antitoxin module